ncbi:Spc19-domain-containing protein [Mycena maculata]|uniref:DASH complex subunit SPC19 n=1 Tax=Mycena maculata TaxID=230809 RepID=A0AAD7HWW6_9AGAR|nr:Spc19-domain-containing protein [Mycena maculata]
MSRLSRANLKGRESVFAGGPDLYRGDIQATCPPGLEECVLIMEDCCEEAYEAQMLLHNGTQDLRRMNQVLQSQRVFLLVGDETVRKYKSELTDEIEPAINELIVLAEQGLKSLQKKESVLQTKVEHVDTAQSRTARPTAGAPASQKMEARRLQLLTKQREALESEIEALEAEVNAMVCHIKVSHAMLNPDVGTPTGKSLNSPHGTTGGL